MFKHHSAGWLPLVLANTIYNIFHPFPATDEYPHVVNREMEGKGLANVGWQTRCSESHMVVICLLIHIVPLFPPLFQYTTERFSKL